MNPTFVIDLAVLGVYAHRLGQWFRQREVRANADLLWEWGRGAYEGPGLHNTQILRRLEYLAAAGQAEKKNGQVPEYKFSRVGAEAIFKPVREYSITCESLHEFLLAHYFFSSNKNLLLKAFAGDKNLELLINPKQLLAERLEYLGKLETHWQERLANGKGLIEGERARKIWSPSLDWIQHQKRLLAEL